MASCCQNVFDSSALVTLIVGSIVSIAISAWQNESDSNGLDATYNGETGDFCDTYPYNYLRPNRFTYNSGGDRIYCGYGEGNTGYRLTVACCSFVSFVLLMFAFQMTFLQIETVRSSIWLIFSILWFTVTVADISSLANGSLACMEFASNYDGNMGAKCELTDYGITVAVDLMMSFLVITRYIALIYFKDSMGPGYGVAK